MLVAVVVSFGKEVLPGKWYKCGQEAGEWKEEITLIVEAGLVQMGRAVCWTEVDWMNSSLLGWVGSGWTKRLDQT